jgi:hypothetical protein
MALMMHGCPVKLFMKATSADVQAGITAFKKSSYGVELAFAALVAATKEQALGARSTSHSPSTRLECLALAIMWIR